MPELVINKVFADRLFVAGVKLLRCSCGAQIFYAKDMNDKLMAVDTEGKSHKTNCSLKENNRR